MRGDLILRGIAKTSRLEDLIQRGIAKRCVSKDGRNAQTRGHPSRRHAKSAAPLDEGFEMLRIGGATAPFRMRSSCENGEAVRRE